MSAFFARFSGSGYVCAHRGARSIAPENTLMALEQARQCGADLWETDIQLTSDGVPVIFHDDTLERTTDIAAVEEFRGRSPWRLADFSCEELQRLDAGSWFLTADPFGTLASGELGEADAPRIRTQKIPRLNEVLHYCRRHDFPVNLEIKDQSACVRDDVVVTTVMDQVNESGIGNLVLVSSFNHDYLRLIKQLNPEIATAALVEYRHPDNLINYLKDLAVEAYHPDHQLTDAALIRQLTASGIRTNLWTVNDVERARYFIEAGATFICSDWPQRLVGGSHAS